MHFRAEIWTSRTIFEPAEKLALYTVVRSSADGDLPLLPEGNTPESLMETLVVGILLFPFVIAAILNSVIFVTEFPSDEREFVGPRMESHTYRVVYNPDNKTAARIFSEGLDVKLCGRNETFRFSIGALVWASARQH